MEFFNGTDESRSSRYFLSVVISTIIHILILIILLSAPFFKKSQPVSMDVLDVTLYDFSNFSGDIVPGKIPDNPAENKPKSVPEKKELVDPSEAELKRMKKRKEPPKKQENTDQENEKSFSMKSGFLPGGSGKAEGSMKLDTRTFPFVYYLAMMKNKISENWIPPFGSVKAQESKRVVIMFRVDRTGRVLSPAVEESSRDNLLDQSALRAVIVSGPFPPLPDGYPDSTLGVHFGFKCQL